MPTLHNHYADLYSLVYNGNITFVLLIIILGNCPCGSFFLQIDVRSSIFLQIVVPDKYLKNYDNLLFNWLLLFIFPSSQILQIVVVVNFSKTVVLDIFSQICQFTAAVFRKLIIVKSFFTTICSR